MALTRAQQVGGVCNQVAWFGFRDRMKVIWACLTRRVKD